jgi:eukaryotic-like serine/threonine-protein kinase
VAPQFGKYRVVKPLARGGMGEVFLARYEGPAGFSRTTVVKRILPHLASEPAFIEMFLHEARTAAMLQHPNVVQILELGQAEDTWFIAMEFIDGSTLRNLQRAHSDGAVIDEVLVAHIAAQALAGLHYAHTLVAPDGQHIQVVHRDLSPDNIMVGFNGQVKVLDFGIAKATGAVQTAHTGAVKGKIAYMAPEQISAAPIDGRTDVYAMGVLLYELLAKERPFVAANEAAMVYQVLHGTVAPLTDKAPHVAPAMAAIVDRAIQRKPEDRFATAKDMAESLEAFVTSRGGCSQSRLASFMTEVLGQPGKSAASTVKATPSPQPGPTRLPTPEPAKGMKRRWSARHALVAATVMTSVAALGVGAVLVASTPPPSPPPLIAQTAAPLEADAGQPPLAVALPVVSPPPVDQPPVLERTTPDAGSVRLKAGSVQLRVNPYAEVFEGSKRLGLTPMAPLVMSPGVHLLTLKNDELQVTRKVSIRVKSGVQSIERFDLLAPQ